MSVPLAIVKELQGYDQRLTVIEQERSKYIPNLHAFYAYCIPERFDRNQTSMPIGQKAAYLFAEKLYSALLANGQQWFQLRLSGIAEYMIRDYYSGSEDAANEEILRINKALSNYSNLIHKQLEASNLYQHAIEAFAELSNGNGCLLCQSSGEDIYDGSSLKFSFIRIDELFLSGANDKLDFVGRVLKIKMRQLPLYWPSAFNHEEFYSTQANKLEEDVEIADICVLEGKNWKNIVYYRGEHSRGKILEVKYEQNPYMVATWRKNRSSSVYGYGPLTPVLKNVEIANKVRLATVYSSMLSAYGVYLAKNELFGNQSLQITPKNVIYVRGELGPNDPGLTRLDKGVPVDLRILEMQLASEIMEAVYGSANAQSDGASPTATEKMIQDNSDRSRATVAFARMINSICVPIVNRSIEILKNEGAIAKISMITNSGKKDFIPYIGKLVSLDHIAPVSVVDEQREIDNMVRAVQLSNAIAGVSVTGTNFNLEKMSQDIFDKFKLQKFNRDEDEKKEMEQKMKEAMAASIPQQEGQQNAGF